MEAKPKNKEQRSQYFLDSKNWEESKGLNVRVVALKGTHLARIEARMCDDWQGDHWVDLGTYQFDSSGNLESVYSLSGGHLDRRLMLEFREEKNGIKKR